jgi:hypothetical protein
MDEENPVPVRNPGMLITGSNMFVLIIYTVLTKAGNNSGGIIFDAFLIVIHSFICFGMASNKETGKHWRLSGLLVLLIGFSTCTNFFGIIK